MQHCTKIHLLFVVLLLTILSSNSILFNKHQNVSLFIMYTLQERNFISIEHKGKSNLPLAWVWNNFSESLWVHTFQTLFLLHFWSWENRTCSNCNMTLPRNLWDTTPKVGRSIPGSHADTVTAYYKLMTHRNDRKPHKHSTNPIWMCVPNSSFP